MPLQQTSGNVTADAFGGGVAAVPVYIEDVMSTYLYTGNSSTQTITNSIDLSTKGGLVWIKSRNWDYSHYLTDTVRGTNSQLRTNTTNGQDTDTQRVTSFLTTGFTLGTAVGVNNSAYNYASWTFRKQPKFFDIQTWTGTGSNTTIAHNLGSVPGCIIVKRTDAVGDWAVYHRAANGGSGQGQWYLILNTTAGLGLSSTYWNNTAPTSTVFSIGTNAAVNASGGTYVAYVYAHDAGGFGLTGTDNVISCGSFTTDGSGSATVNLGYESQFILFKNTVSSENWMLFDTFRGLPAPGTFSGRQQLKPNLSDAESSNNYASVTNTGFDTQNLYSSQAYIYIAIRRGPMKVPTDATKVFAPAIRTGTGAAATITSSTYPVDMTWIRQRNAASGYSFMEFDRLRGVPYLLYTNNDQSQNNASYTLNGFDVQNGYYLGDDAFGYGTNVSGQPIVYYNFRRAPGFFDEVCYTGTGSATTKNHNLGVVPELMIMKSRSTSGFWWSTYHAALGNTQVLFLNTTDATATSSQPWNDTTPTASVFTIGNLVDLNTNGTSYVAYLFATCPGVSKVFSFTGNGSTQTINCGFAAGARFVLLKATSATGGWYVYDTARGMTVLTDPYLFMNSTAAEVATLGSVTTVTTGFAVNAAITAGVNTNGVSYIGLAIA
jgi:hypothetical protein